MRCERIQELVITDYADGVLDEKTLREVEEHLASCAGCREFRRIAACRAISPFRLIRAKEAPSYLWERVKANIAAEENGHRLAVTAAADIIRDILWSLGRIPRPAVAFAAAAALIIAVLVARPIAQTRAVDDYLERHVDFMIGLEAVEPNGNGYFSTEINTGVDHMV